MSVGMSPGAAARRAASEHDAGGGGVDARRRDAAVAAADRRAADRIGNRDRIQQNATRRHGGYTETLARHSGERNFADSFCIFLRLRPSSAYGKPYLPIYLANIDLSNKN